MNFNDSSSDKPLGTKTTGRVSNDSNETPGESTLDREAMDSATRAQDRQHKNENTNSSNTIFSK
jgi:hypothetical protein